MFELIPRLTAPFLPEEARHRVRQQRFDAEAARRAARVLRLPGVSATVVNATVGMRSRGKAELGPLRPLRKGRSAWLDYGRLFWDGTQLTVNGEGAYIGHWQVQEGGLKPGFGAEEVAEAGMRPVTSGECPEAAVEMAAVALGGQVTRRLYLLDEESRHLAMVPALGLTEERIASFAGHVGLAYRAYSVTTGGRVHPDVLCDEVLFPRSSRRVRLVRRPSEDAEWQWHQGWP